MMPEKKILIVEDDRAISIFITQILESHGFSVTSSFTGKDALENVKKTDYITVLLDIVLPDIKGTELLKRIRLSNKDLIIIIITGNPSLESSIESVLYNADGYLIKPLNSKKLISIVEEKLLERFGQKVNNTFI